MLLGLSAVGFFTSLGVDNVPAAAPEKPFRLNIVGDLWVQIGKMRKDRALFLAVLGNTYFWFLGSLLFSTIVIYGPDVSAHRPDQDRLPERHARRGHRHRQHGRRMGERQQDRVRADSAGLDRHDVTGFALGVTPHGMAGSAVLLGMLGFWAGFFAVPVNALIQHKPAEEDKGGIIAAANLLSFVGIAISSGVYFVFTPYIHLDPRGVIVAASSLLHSARLMFCICCRSGSGA